MRNEQLEKVKAAHGKIVNMGPDYHLGAVAEAFEEADRLAEALDVDRTRLHGRIEQYAALVWDNWPEQRMSEVKLEKLPVLTKGTTSEEQLRAKFCEIGICPDCFSEIRHHLDEPFSSCDCTTGEDTGNPPLIQELRRKASTETPVDGGMPKDVVMMVGENHELRNRVSAAEGVLNIIRDLVHESDGVSGWRGNNRVSTWEDNGIRQLLDSYFNQENGRL